ncbi:MAG: 16S rRNA (guanine(527)-N(7))-methyltransferase RsmG, partial [Actinobacteria bacterium]|nr:16S rRNA (guanine(527)-N(7))-methyltransferase RsmG [Actinomycetota bacterium]
MAEEGTLASPVPGAAAELYGDGLGTIEAYVAVLATRGVEWGLIGPREVPRLWERHILNSAAIAGLVPSGASVVDVGSGAGLPGIPLAVLRPDLDVVLLEPLLRRADFLTETVRELDLADRVRVVRGRAEEHKASYDVVTCRAVAPLGRLLGWTGRLFLPGGQLVAMKGASAADEVAASRKELA